MKKMHGDNFKILDDFPTLGILGSTQKTYTYVWFWCHST